MVRRTGGAKASRLEGAEQAVEAVCDRTNHREKSTRLSSGEACLLYEQQHLLISDNPKIA